MRSKLNELIYIYGSKLIKSAGGHYIANLIRNIKKKKKAAKKKEKKAHYKTQIISHRNSRQDKGTPTLVLGDRQEAEGAKVLPLNPKLR